MKPKGHILEENEKLKSIIESPEFLFKIMKCLSVSEARRYAKQEVRAIVESKQLECQCPVNEDTIEAEFENNKCISCGLPIWIKHS